MSDNNYLYRDLVILYCPEKVGSTSIVSSIRISASDKFMVLHTHEDKIADIVNLGCEIKISDLIQQQNKILNPITNEFRKIYLIDIYRTPIERKISSFFQKISEIHFNNTEQNISTYPVDKIIKRFNDIFIHVKEIDYFNQFYKCEPIKESEFDFNSKYLLKQSDNIYMIKLRLEDSNEWNNILTQILGTQIHMIWDYDTKNKIIGNLYLEFKNNYKLPYNYYELIKEEINSCPYLKIDEKKDYLKKWLEKITCSYTPFTNEQYDFYKMISLENKFYCANTANLHYNDDGCVCSKCFDKRKNILENLKNGIKQDNILIRHNYDTDYNNNVFIKICKKKSINEFDKIDEFEEIIINLINS